MRLTDLCKIYKWRRDPIGFAYRGKNRKLHPILQSQMLNLKQELEMEEENMLWLRHPYLTIEQECGHMKAKKLVSHQEFVERSLKIKTRHFAKTVKIVDRLKGLMVSDKWE